jgi:hypothetical protein
MLRLVDYDSNGEEEDESKKEGSENDDTEFQSSGQETEVISDATVPETAPMKTSMALSVCSAPDVVPMVNSFSLYYRALNERSLSDILSRICFLGQ